MKSSALPLLIIVGAGGLGSELLGCVLSDPASDNEWCLAGFLDDRTEKDDDQEAKNEDVDEDEMGGDREERR